MKILTTLHDQDNLEDLLKVADGIILGQKGFAKTLTVDFEEDTHEIIKKVYRSNKEVFILLNRIFTDKELIDVKSLFKKHYQLT